MVAELVRLTRVIMTSAADMRVQLERIGGMERALMELQGRADQATTALQALQQQQQPATTAQHARRRAAGSSSHGHRCISCR